jgi:predicted DNA-binding transcriptional regulator YafY
MRGDRLLSILLLLQVHRRMTAQDLAKRLEVSERTIHRDMEVLSAAGIPVYAQRGSGGGWILREEFRTNLTGLTETEIQTLFLSRPARLLADLGWQQASEAALIKLLAALPATSRHDAEYARQRIHVDVAGWHQAEDNVSSLSTVQEAIWQERKLHLTYHRSDGTTVERLVDPLGLVVKGSAWYLVAAVEGEMRTYRVSRLQGARMTDQRCVRPHGFDLAAYWEQSSTHYKASLPRYPVTVRVAPDVLSKVSSAARYAYARVEHVGAPEAEGWITLQLLFETEEEACGYVLRFGPWVEIVEPPDLRERVIRLAAGVVDFYAHRPCAGPMSRGDSDRI